MARSQSNEPYAMRSGCKVGWYYYRTKAAALRASAKAKATAIRRAEQGYDFGFCSPGAIRFIDPAENPKSAYRGLWEVTVP